MTQKHPEIAALSTSPSESTLIDIGLNLSNSRFNQDRQAVLQRALDAGVSQAVITGTCLDSSKQAVDLCRHYNDDFPGMLHATAGVHPHDAKSWNNNTRQQLHQLSLTPEVVAIGETGLDFNRNYSPPSDQEYAFEQQLELAADCGLPLFLHERDAHQRQLEILSTYREKISRAVIHCFTGTRQQLYNYLDLDFYIGITAWICDPKRGRELQQIVKDIPLRRLMIETDAPFLWPKNLKHPKNHKHPKNQPSMKNRNEPAHLGWVLKQIALCRLESQAELARSTRACTLEFFALPC